ncbi:hypothetical protein F4775DRAFT_539200 [Biscogniauxia sp. FL1348]|nr:hypothetical protein F4775DRAFT_539200 [Biscogniauxia sp. FL1348]
MPMLHWLGWLVSTVQYCVFVSFSPFSLPSVCIVHYGAGRLVQTKRSTRDHSRVGANMVMKPSPSRSATLPAVRLLSGPSRRLS